MGPSQVRRSPSDKARSCAGGEEGSGDHQGTNVVVHPWASNAGTMGLICWEWCVLTGKSPKNGLRSGMVVITLFMGVGP